MIRPGFPVAALALLAACGQAAEESDDQGNAISAERKIDVAVTGGERPSAFAQCTTCHAVEPGQNRIGPSLAGVYGARAGHVGDFAYSQAMRQSGLVWDEPTLDRFLATPMRTVPGTKMAFPGLRDAEQRKAVVAYLKTL